VNWKDISLYDQDFLHHLFANILNKKAEEYSLEIIWIEEEFY